MFSALARWATNLHVAYDRRRAIESLSKLSDFYLRDIGLERDGVAEYVSQTLPWRERTASPAHRARPAIQGCG